MYQIEEDLYRIKEPSANREKTGHESGSPSDGFAHATLADLPLGRCALLCKSNKNQRAPNLELQGAHLKNCRLRGAVRIYTLYASRSTGRTINLYRYISEVLTPNRPVPLDPHRPTPLSQFTRNHRRW